MQDQRRRQQVYRDNPKMCGSGPRDAKTELRGRPRATPRRKLSPKRSESQTRQDGSRYDRKRPRSSDIYVDSPWGGTPGSSTDPRPTMPAVLTVKLTPPWRPVEVKGWQYKDVRRLDQQPVKDVRRLDQQRATTNSWIIDREISTSQGTHLMGAGFQRAPLRRLPKASQGPQQD